MTVVTDVDSLLIVAGLFLASVVAGFVDSIAGGGGLITLPALLAAGFPAHLAAGTNKLQSSCGTALAAWRYAKAGWVTPKKLWRAGWVTFIAAGFGAWLAMQISPAPYRRVLPILLFFPLAYMVLQPRLQPMGTSSESRLSTGLPLLGIVLGIYDGFFGPGTGSFWMLGLMTLGGLEIPRATGMTKIMNLASNLAALAWFAWAGQVHYRMGLVMIAGQLIGSAAGSTFAVRHGAKAIRPIFIGVVIALIVRLLWS